VTTTTGRQRGRAPAATHEDVLEVAGRVFAAGERVDLRAIAAELGLARVSLYRWYGSREGLLEALLLHGFRREFADAVRRSRGRGGQRVLDVCDHLMRAFAAAEPMHAFVASEPKLARRIMTSPDGVVHQEKVASLEALIRDETGHAGWTPTVDVHALAYVAVHLMEDLNFSDPAHGLQGDRTVMLEVLGALLGIPTPPP
jgi:AcrR family transcriptional regulator